MSRKRLDRHDYTREDHLPRALVGRRRRREFLGRNIISFVYTSRRAESCFGWRCFVSFARFVSRGESSSTSSINRPIISVSMIIEFPSPIKLPVQVLVDRATGELYLFAQVSYAGELGERSK